MHKIVIVKIMYTYTYSYFKNVFYSMFLQGVMSKSNYCLILNAEFSNRREPYVQLSLINVQKVSKPLKSNVEFCLHYC